MVVMGWMGRVLFRHDLLKNSLWVIVPEIAISSRDLVAVVGVKREGDLNILLAVFEGFSFSIFKEQVFVAFDFIRRTDVADAFGVNE